MLSLGQIQYLNTLHSEVERSDLFGCFTFDYKITTDDDGDRCEHWIGEGNGDGIRIVGSFDIAHFIFTYIRPGTICPVSLFALEKAVLMGSMVSSTR